MSRNVTIVIIILILVVLAGYLVWIRNRLAPSLKEQIEETPTPTVFLSPTPIQSGSTPTATPSATPKVSPTKAQRVASPTATPR